MSDLDSLASAYRNAKAENAAAYDEMETAHTAFDAATARWEASGRPVAIARKALLERAASGIETEGQDAQRLGAEHESPAPKADAQ